METNELTQYKGVWCCAEVRRGALVAAIFELLHAGRKLADQLGEPLCAVLVGNGVKKWTNDLIEAGAEKVYVLDHPALENFVDETHAQALAVAIRQAKPSVFLVSASTAGRSLASRLGVTLNTGAGADVSELSVETLVNGTTNAQVCAVRSTHGGNLFASIVFPKARPIVISVRPMAFPRAEKIAGKTGEIIDIALNPSEWKVRTKFVQFMPEENADLDIGSADKIVAAGRGLGKAEGFGMVRAFAKILGAAVGASRAAVDAGWITYRHQVGLTGRTVRPKLYIALGISGQVQHLAGMGQSETIVAINKDPDCPLMKVASLSVEADLYEFIPLVIEKLKQQKN
ncbi:MAG: electron transfer flavoprotein subunit alpha/FixB family protein [Elusimicrobiota bacterium]